MLSLRVSLSILPLYVPDFVMRRRVHAAGWKLSKGFFSSRFPLMRWRTSDSSSLLTCVSVTFTSPFSVSGEDGGRYVQSEAQNTLSFRYWSGVGSPFPAAMRY